MPRPALALLLVALLVVVAALVAYLLLARSEPSVPVVREPGPAGPAPTRPDAAPPSVPVTPLAVGASRPSPPVGPAMKDGVLRDRGAVRVRLSFPADLDPATVGVRLDLTPKGPAPSDYPLPLRQEDGTWLYEALPVGGYRVRVVADGLQAAEGHVTVARDEEADLPLTLVPGGALAYRAVLFSGDTPEHVRLSLVDGRGVPVAASVQLPAGLVHLSGEPRMRTLELPAAATVVGLKPGTYRVRATAPSGEFDEQAVEVAAGGPTPVELRIRK